MVPKVSLVLGITIDPKIETRLIEGRDESEEVSLCGIWWLLSRLGRNEFKTLDFEIHYEKFYTFQKFEATHPLG